MGDHFGAPRVGPLHKRSGLIVFGRGLMPVLSLPLVFPGMISVAMLCWIFAWNEYLFANLLTGTTVKTFPVHIPSFTQGSQTLWNLVMAFSMVAMIPPVGMFIILRKYMVRGLSLGVVKG